MMVPQIISVNRRDRPMKKRSYRIAMAVLVACCVLTLSPIRGYASEADDALQALETENAELKEQIQQLEEKISELEDKVAALEAENEELKAAQAEEELGTEIVGVQYTDKSVVKLVQEELNKKGYNCGSPDGVAGTQTTESIKAYQKDNKINVNGVITDELLESMGIADKVDEAAKLEASKAEYSSDYTYDQLARNPDSYIGDKVKFYGRVLQAETGDTCYIRLAINGSYDNVLFVTYDKDLLSYRLLEDDYVTVYGTAFSTFSYEAVSGATITLPWIVADIIELQ